MSAPQPPFTAIATTAFGLEAVVSRELKALGFENLETRDGMIRFQTDWEGLFRANLWLRSADRIQIELFEAKLDDFGDLFDLTKSIAWENWIGIDDQFPVTCRSVRSTLHHEPTCQSLVKKAIVERLKQVHPVLHFAETGLNYPVHLTLRNDLARLVIDTTGPALNKRGYRSYTGSAPIRETLAAALIQLSYWNSSRLLVDFCCGTGTIPIEAAMIGRRIAPGIERSFLFEQWPQVPLERFEAIREQARAEQLPELEVRIQASDLNDRELRAARQHASNAGVANDIHFQQKDLQDFQTSTHYGCLITNPPYGDRLETSDSVRELNRLIGEACRPLEDWSLYLISGADGFEEDFGRKANRRRKLYNGPLECQYYQYLGPRPPRK